MSAYKGTKWSLLYRIYLIFCYLPMITTLFLQIYGEKNDRRVGIRPCVPLQALEGCPTAVFARPPNTCAERLVGGFEMDLSLLLLQGDPFAQVSLWCVVLFILILVWQVSTMKLKKAVLNSQVRHPTGGIAKKGYEYFNQRKFAYFSRVNKFLNQ